MDYDGSLAPKELESFVVMVRGMMKGARKCAMWKFLICPPTFSMKKRDHNQSTLHFSALTSAVWLKSLNVGTDGISGERGSV